ncbi:hypothetical protein DRN86_01625, partial [Candidatus Geothermarchaeota archaeon]
MNMLYFTKRQRICVWVISVLISIVTLFSLVTLGVYVPQPPYLIPLKPEINNIIALTLIISIFSPSIVEIVNIKYVKKVNKDLLRLVRDIISGISSGLTMTKALEEIAADKYGPVSEGIKKSFSRFMLGEDFTKSILNMGKELGTTESKQISMILATSYESGAKVADVLSAADSFFRTIEDFR